LFSHPLPCTLPASRPSVLMNHPLPPKPPISVHFHAYTPPARNPRTALRDMAAQHVDHGNFIPVSKAREGPSAHHNATVSSIGVLSSPHIDTAIYQSTKGLYRCTMSCCLSLSLIRSLAPSRYDHQSRE
jgi:hypothetical protein